MTSDMMKKIILVFVASVISMMPMFAQTLADGQVEAQNVHFQKNTDGVSVDFDLDMTNLTLSGNKGLVFIPKIVSATDTLSLTAIEIYGRLRDLYWQRNEKTATDSPALVCRRHNGTEQVEHYSYSGDFQPWMKNSWLEIVKQDCGCAQKLSPEDGDAVKSEGIDNGAEPQVEPEPEPETNIADLPWKFAYAKPAPEEVKQRAESGSARLNFEVDKYYIRPDFGNNSAELEKIRQTIDLVRNDEDVKLTGISLHGYASPDGPYSHNADLAKNRTLALEKYLESYYRALDKSIFSSDSTPEDWDGFREYMDTCDCGARLAILKIIDDENMTPDEKDWTIMMRYTTFYRKVVIPVIYPSLRRTDYSVTYDVRNFNLEEAKRILRERPQKLSLNEMYAVADTYLEGSEEYNEVFETAVRMFPESEPANVNAACIALEKNDMKSAAKYLANAGDSDEAKNARGVYAAKNGDKDAAVELFREASHLQAAQENLEMLLK